MKYLLILGNDAYVTFTEKQRNLRKKKSFTYIHIYIQCIRVLGIKQTRLRYIEWQNSNEDIDGNSREIPGGTEENHENTLQDLGIPT